MGLETTVRAQADLKNANRAVTQNGHKRVLFQQTSFLTLYVVISMSVNMVKRYALLALWISPGVSQHNAAGGAGE